VDYSSDLAQQLDQGIREIIAEAHQTARRVLEEHRSELDYVAEILLKRETIERAQFIELLEGKSEDEVFLDMPPSGRHSTRQARRQRRGAARRTRPGSGRQPAPARTPA
jgi:cell division protease FtsH